MLPSRLSLLASQARQGQLLLPASLFRRSSLNYSTTYQDNLNNPNNPNNPNSPNNPNNPNYRQPTSNPTPLGDPAGLNTQGSPDNSSTQGGPDPSSSGTQDSGFFGPPKIVVLGGRGFVGSHVCQEALSTGMQVIGVSRSGTPPLVRDSWVDQVEWARGNTLEPQTYSSLLKGATAVISCIGGFGSQSEMMRTNGTANVMAIEAAKNAGVQRFVFVSAHIPNIPGIDSVMQGYVRGKQQAEEALRQHFPDSGVALRPSVIYGNRVVSQNLTLPLGVAFQPLEMLLANGPAKQMSSIPFIGAAFVPPTNVQVVARAAVRAATDSSVPAGVIDVWELQQYK